MSIGGFEAIANADGWAMAITGAVIVMSGLSILATIISQLHRIVAIFEKSPQPAAPSVPHVCRADLIGELKKLGLDDTADAARICCGLTADLGASFELSELYQLLAKENLPHLHLTVRSLRQNGFLVSAGGSRFSWK